MDCAISMIRPCIGLAPIPGTTRDWGTHMSSYEVRDKGILGAVVLLDRRRDSALELLRPQGMGS